MNNSKSWAVSWRWYSLWYSYFVPINARIHLKESVCNLVRNESVRFSFQRQHDYPIDPRAVNWYVKMVIKKYNNHMFVIYIWSKKVINCSCSRQWHRNMVTKILFIFIFSCLCSSLIMSTCQMATKTLEITR